jgi:hypothetical protein
MRGDLSRDFHHSPITFEELEESLEKNREEFLDGPKSCYHFKNPSSYSNSIANCLLVKEMLLNGYSDSAMDMILFSVRDIIDQGYSLTFQAIKPQHDSAARPIVVQTSTAKVSNWPHQRVFGIINETSPTEMTSMPSFDQQMTVQSVGVVGDGLQINDDMGSWSGSDFKEKFRFVVHIMIRRGLIDERVGNILLTVMTLSDRLRICVPFANSEKHHPSRIYHRGWLVKMPLDEDSFKKGDHLRTGFGSSKNRQGGVSPLSTKGGTWNPLTQEKTQISDWFVVITMENGWMQGLFHSISSFVHDIQMSTYKHLVSRLYPELKVSYLVHSDDKNVGISGKMNSVTARRLVAINTNLVNLFGLQQSTSKSSSTWLNDIGSFKEGANFRFSEFLGSVTCQGVSYSSNSRQWGVMNGCQHDNPIDNLLAIISSHMNVLNLGACPIHVEFSLWDCIAELQKRFGLKKGFSGDSDFEIGGLRVNNVLEYLGYPCISVVEFRALGTSGDKLFKMIKYGSKISGQIEDLPSFITMKRMRKKLSLTIERLSEEFISPETHIYGEVRRLSSMRGVSKAQEAGLGLLSMGIGARLGKWKTNSGEMSAKELLSKSSFHSDFMTDNFINPRMLPILSDSSKLEAAKLLGEVRLIRSDPKKMFFGFGDLRISQFDITNSFEEVEEILLHDGMVNPIMRSKFRKLGEEIDGFCRAYGIRSTRVLLESEGVWEMHRNQNRFSHIISNQYSGLYDFPHKGVKFELPADAGSYEMMKVNTFSARVTIRELSRDPFNFLSRVQDEINSASISAMQNINVREVSVRRRIIELSHASDVPTNLKLRGIPGSTQRIIRSILGGEFNFDSSYLVYSGEIEEFNLYDHISMNRVVNKVKYNVEDKVFSIQVNIQVTRELIKERFPDSSEESWSGNCYSIGKVWGGDMSTIWISSDLIVMCGKRGNKELSSKVSCEIPKLPSTIIFDASTYLGVIELRSSKSYRVKTGSLQYPCNRMHGANSWNERRQLRQLKDKLALPECDEDHANLPEVCFCNHENVVLESFGREAKREGMVDRLCEVLEDSRDSCERLWIDVRELIRSVVPSAISGIEPEIFMSMVGFPSISATYAYIMFSLRSTGTQRVSAISRVNGRIFMTLENDWESIDLETRESQLGCWMISPVTRDICLDKDVPDPIREVFSDSELAILERIEKDQPLPLQLGDVNVFKFLTEIISGRLIRRRNIAKLEIGDKVDLDEFLSRTVNEDYLKVVETFRNEYLGISEIPDLAMDIGIYRVSPSKGNNTLKTLCRSDSSGKIIPTKLFWEILLRSRTGDYPFPFSTIVWDMLVKSYGLEGKAESARWSRHYDRYVYPLELDCFNIMMSLAPRLTLEVVSNSIGGVYTPNPSFWGTLLSLKSGRLSEVHSNLIFEDEIWLYIKTVSDRIPELSELRGIDSRKGSNSIFSMFMDKEKSLPIWSDYLERYLVWIPYPPDNLDPDLTGVNNSIDRIRLRMAEISGSNNLPGVSLRESMRNMTLEMSESFVLMESFDKAYEKKDLVRSLTQSFRGNLVEVEEVMESIVLDTFPALVEKRYESKYAHWFSLKGLSYTSSRISRPPVRTELIYKTDLPFRSQKYHPMIDLIVDGSAEMESARNFIARMNSNEISPRLREEFEKLKASCSILPNQQISHSRHIDMILNQVKNQALVNEIRTILI